MLTPSLLGNADPKNNPTNTRWNSLIRSTVAQIATFVALAGTPGVQAGPVSSGILPQQTSSSPTSINALSWPEINFNSAFFSFDGLTMNNGGIVYLDLFLNWVGDTIESNLSPISTFWIAPTNITFSYLWLNYGAQLWAPVNLPNGGITVSNWPYTLSWDISPNGWYIGTNNWFLATSMNAVPESSSGALAVLGLSALGLAALRRKSAPGATPGEEKPETPAV